MKKFSTAAALLAFATLFVPVAHAAKTPQCNFMANAPDQHLVVRGDTLWDIAGKFLEHPWCWPQVWGMNKDQIADPHWIYPGQIVYFDRKEGRLRLGTGISSGKSATVRMSPQLRMESLGKDAIPAIPTSAIEPFLAQPLIIEENELAGAPRIVAVQEGRVMLGKNEKAFVRGDLKDATVFQTFRTGTPLRDPTTKEIIGYEAVYLGTLKLDRAAGTAAEAHRMVVTNSRQEMGVGDRLIAMPPAAILNYSPHSPEQPVDGRIVSVYGGVTQAGQHSIVTINRGKADGLDRGSVLHLYRFGQTIADRTDGNKPVKLPDEQYGALFVFRVFNKISYALVMQVRDAVQIGDIVKSPE